MTIDRAITKVVDEEYNHLRIQVVQQGRCLKNWIRNVQDFLNTLDEILPGTIDKVTEDGEFGPGLAQWIGERIEQIVEAKLGPEIQEKVWPQREINRGCVEARCSYLNTVMARVSSDEPETAMESLCCTREYCLKER